MFVSANYFTDHHREKKSIAFPATETSSYWETTVYIKSMNVHHLMVKTFHVDRSNNYGEAFKNTKQ